MRWLGSLFQKRKTIHLDSKFSREDISGLLASLSAQNTIIDFCDRKFPDGKPWTNFTYAPFNGKWRMCYSAHGRSMGIYTVRPSTITGQIFDLLKKGHISKLGVNNKSLPALDLQVFDKNLNIDGQLFASHNKVNEDASDYLIFGLFDHSDYYNTQRIYKVTHQGLFVDAREKLYRDGYKGYRFKGSRVPGNKEKVARSLWKAFPKDMLSRPASGFYTAGGKDAVSVLFSFGNDQFARTFSLDVYCGKWPDAPKELLDFGKSVVAAIREIEK